MKSHLFSTGFSHNLTSTNLLNQDNEGKKKITRPMSQPVSDSQCQHVASQPKCSVFTRCIFACLWQGGRRRGNSLFCDPTRNAAKCLHPQRQRGSFGLEAHIVKTPFVLKSLQEFFSFSFNILNIPVFSCPLPIL